MTFGTCYFVSENAALRYYRRQDIHTTPKDIQYFIGEGSIHIGIPPTAPWETTCLLDGGTRYGIKDTRSL